MQESFENYNIMKRNFEEIIDEMLIDGYFEDMTSEEGALEMQNDLKQLKADRDFYKEMYYKIAFPEDEIKVYGLGVE